MNREVREAEQEKRYPCPDCVNTMLPGVSYSFPRTDTLERGIGKRYYPYSGAASTMVVPQATLQDCHRCEGTGLVTERRVGAGRRALPVGRRAVDRG